MIFKIKIMSEGDQVLNCWDDKIAIRRVNGEVDIYQMEIAENNLPTLSNEVWRITYGNNTIEIIDKDSTSQNESSKSKSQRKSSKSTKSSISPSKNGNLLPCDDENDADFVMSIRPKKG